MAFENKAPSIHKMKPFFFFSIIWSWANLYSVDNISSLLDFLACIWGSGFWFFLFPFLHVVPPFLVPFCIPLIYILVAFGFSFFINILCFTD